MKKIVKRGGAYGKRRFTQRNRERKETGTISSSGDIVTDFKKELFDALKQIHSKNVRKEL